jgi:tetratricopeptide (TPR) repeat protein
MADLKSWAAQSGDDPQALKTAVAELLRAPGFLDWQASDAYAQRAYRVLPLLGQTMRKDPQAARALCEQALLRIYEVAQDADDSSGALGDLARELQASLVDSLACSPPAASWLERWFALMAADPCDDWDRRHVLDRAGPVLQEAYSRKVTADWLGYSPGPSVRPTRMLVASVHKWDYQRIKLRERYLEELQHQGDVLAVIEAMRSSVQGPGEHGQLVAYCETQHKFREALQFAQAAYALFPSDSRTERDVLRCYEREGCHEEALAIRHRYLEKAPTAENFLALLKAASAAGKDLAAYRMALYQWAEAKELEPKPENPRLATAATGPLPARQVGTRAEWLMAEGLVAQALALVQPPHAGPSGLLWRIALQLPQAQHADAVALLQRAFAEMMPGASTPYLEVLAVVRETCLRMDSQPRKHWLLHLRVQYKAKRNFIKGLEGL